MGGFTYLIAEIKINHMYSSFYDINLIIDKNENANFLLILKKKNIAIKPNNGKTKKTYHHYLLHLVLLGIHFVLKRQAIVGMY